MNPPGRHSTLLVFSCLLAVTLIALPALAQQPWDGPAFSGDSAAILKAANTVSVANDVNVVILLREDRYYFEADGRSTYTRRMVYRIMNAQGAEGWAEIDSDYSPWYEQRPEIRARVITADGAVHMLDPATLNDAPAQDESEDVYSDRRVLRGPLPAVAPGAVVEEETVVRETAPLLAAGVVHEVYFTSTVPRQHSRIEINYPASLPLQHTAQLLPSLVVKKSEADGRIVLNMEVGSQAPFERPEPLMPADVPAYPMVAFATGRSWQSIAEHYGQIVDTQIGGADLARVVSAAIKGKTSRPQIVSAVLDRLHQDVRYTGVEYAEAAIIPRSPAETLKRRYGDCKDKAALLIAMLRQAGITAHFALLSTGPGQDVFADLPGMGAFDHAIVYAPGTPDYWIDATAEDWRLGDLPTSNQGRMALVIAPGTTALTRIPVAPTSANRFVETRLITLAETGPARITETTETFGSVEGSFRSSYGEAGNDTRKQLEEYVKSTYLAESLEKFEHSAARDFSQPFRLHLEAGKAGRARTSSVDAVARISAWPLVNRLPDFLTNTEDDKSVDEKEKEKKRRKNDMELPEAYSAEIRVRVVPPPGFRPLSVPAKKVTQIGPASLTQEFTAEKDGAVNALLTFDTERRRFTAAEVEAMKTSIREFAKSDMAMVSFEQVGRAHLAAGKIREALEEFKALAAQHPKEALHRTQTADALLAAGIGDAARQEARRAIELEPTSAEGHRALAWILQHDLVGRRFEKGWDPQGAEAAYRKAIELDKDDGASRVNLAILLEHNSYGDRYGKGARLAEAIQEYQAVKDKLDDLGLPDNLPIALLRAERFGELREVLKTMPSTRNRMALTVAAVAATESPAAALQEARKLSTDEKVRSAVLINAGEMLIKIRRYAAAVDLITAGAPASENPAAQLRRVDTIRGAKRYEDVLLPESDPRSVIRRFYVQFFNPPVTDAIFDIFSKRAYAQKGREEQLKQVQRASLQLRPAMVREGTPMVVIADLVLGVLQLSVEGSEAIGYRIRTQAPGSPSQVFYVVREEGAYRILGMASDAAGVGQRVLELLERKDLESARQWLDWVRDDQQPGGGEDPLSGPLLPRFWERGRTADPTAMRHAAEAMIAGTEQAEIVVAKLQQARGEAQSDAERTSFDLALARSFSKLEKPAELLPVAQRLVQSFPKSESAFKLLQEALKGLERWSEAEQSAKERLKLLPDDVEALRAIVTSGMVQGQVAKVEEQNARLQAIGKAEAQDFNELAWVLLMNGGDTTKAIEAAQRGTVLSRNQEGGIIHTLACLYAEADRTSEAREHLLNLMNVWGLEEPNSEVWYGFARIAEQFGIRDAAVAAYRKVEAPEKKYYTPASTWTLAQRRLKILGATSEKPATSK